MALRESITIRNFGPLKHISIGEMKRVNVFIGVSGSGKSTIMKVIALCQWLYKMQCIRSYLKLSGIRKTPFRYRLANLLKKNGLEKFMRPDTQIVYTNGSCTISIAGNRLSTEGIVPADELALVKVAYISDKRSIIPNILDGDVTVRHGTFYLDETLASFKVALDTIQDTTLPYLGLRMAVKRTPMGRKVYVSSAERGASYQIPLQNASSGAQDAAPIHFITSYLAYHYNLVQSMNQTILSFLAGIDNLSDFKASQDIGAFHRREISLLIEEPELSLFPQNQKGITEHLIRMCAFGRHPQATMSVTLATHSPYILTALNVMTLAHIASEIDSARAAEIVDPDIMLPPDEVAAWEVKDGEIHSLVDDELHLINGSWLDSASDVADEQISRLNEIIYG